MKFFFLFFSFTIFLSCSSDDNSNDGNCWGAFRERDSDGNILWEFKVKRDCAECNRHVNFQCPGEESCFDYYGEPGYNIVGTWECD